MSGLAGVARPGAPRAEAAVRAALRGLARSVPHQVDSRSAQTAAVAVVRPPADAACASAPHHDGFACIAGALDGERTAGELYGTFGAAFNARAEGRYAAVVCDASRERVVLARDPVGHKPLAYTRRGDTLYFASDTRALAALAGPLAPSRAAAAAYLLLNHPILPGSWYAGVESVRPGESIVFDVRSGEMTRTRTPFPRARPSSPRRYPGLLKRALRAAVNGPTGFHLSGGIDSSLLCGLAARRSATRLRTFGAAYSSSEDDARFGAAVAAEINAVHHRVALDADRLCADLDLLIDRLDAPVMAAGVPTFWYLARAAREAGLDALVSGIGADHSAIGHARELRPGGDVARSLFEACCHLPPSFVREFAVSERAFDELVDDVFGAFVAAAGEALAERNAERAVERCFAAHFLQEHLRVADLTHLDWGVEIRSPFLDANVLGCALWCDELAPSPPGSKPLLRTMLAELGSSAAMRTSKAQMALPPALFVRAFGDAVRREFAEESRRLPWLDYGKLTALLDRADALAKYEARLLWVVYNLHRWFAVRGFAADALR